MKRIFKIKSIRIILVLSIIVALIRMAFAWVGSDPLVILTYPSQDSKVLTPFTPRGIVKNSSQGIDYYALEMWLDKNGNGLPDSGDTGVTWHEFYRVENVNMVDVELPNDRVLTSPKAANTQLFRPGRHYLIRIYAVDLNGEASSDTSVKYMSSLNEQGWAETQIKAFEVVGYAP
ncbi:MAG: hypothetical protein ACTSPI_11725 [Candidatus Heimdallarchaeaceae archaeon]